MINAEDLNSSVEIIYMDSQLCFLKKKMAICRLKIKYMDH